MAYYYGTTHKNTINCSSVDWKTLRDFLGLVRSAARARIIRQSQTINFYTDFISKGVDATEQKVRRILWLMEFNSVTRVQRHVRTKWNVVTGLIDRLIRTSTK
ncbi:hypothetical protein TNCV_2171031 [Trichonephila clavipes]|nr:hypothetical protein TNCV_2171031 [Trichonephila clavipes]